MSKIIVLGAGLVGKAMAIDLGKSHEVTAVDINSHALEELEKLGIQSRQVDLSTEDAIIRVVKDFDLVIGSVPGYMGYHTIKSVIKAGKNMVDISFMPQDPEDLNALALENKVIVVFDCGIAPGMSNIILGYHNVEFEVDRFECLVGGLPVIREWPFEYKAVFSPIDVLEEYIRPARYVENGAIITREALSDPELVSFDGLGTLESWNSDGLRSLIRTMKIPNMIEKTLRYPGTIEYLKVLRDSGFFSYNEIDVGGKKIRPIDLTARLLFPKWKLKPGEEDYTVMRIRISGIKNKIPVEHVYNLLDRFDKDTGTISMARTTGYTCNAVANLLLENQVDRKGIIPPEYIGESRSNFDFILRYLEERGVVFHSEKH